MIVTFFPTLYAMLYYIIHFLGYLFLFALKITKTRALAFVCVDVHVCMNVWVCVRVRIRRFLPACASVCMYASSRACPRAKPRPPVGRPPWQQQRDVYGAKFGARQKRRASFIGIIIIIPTRKLEQVGTV